MLEADFDAAYAAMFILGVLAAFDVTVTIAPRPRRAIRLTTERELADVGAIASIGTVGDSDDNALAETVVGL